MTNESKKLREKTQQEIEKQKLLFNADRSKTEGIIFDEQEENIQVKDEIKDLLDSQIDDPSVKYDLYYKCVESIFRDYLPKGESSALIREEKCTFLTGHRLGNNGIRGADSRQATIADMRELLTLLHDWLGRGANPFDLYTTLVEENERRGYGKPE